MSSEATTTDSSHSSQQPSDQEIVSKKFTEILTEHQQCLNDIANYQAHLKQMHALQAEVEAKCTAHYKSELALKSMIKKMDMSEEEKRNKLAELSNLERDSKRWRSYFPYEAKGILNLFLGPADVRMLNPLRRQRYKYVCYSSNRSL